MLSFIYIIDRIILFYRAKNYRTRVPEFDKANIGWVRETVDAIRSKQPDGGAIPNFAYGDEPAEVLFGPENAKRLKEVKDRYDPDGVWKKGVRI